ncbi:hypothetical protein CL619_00740 [archaeon]|nr:hypothetical protein [archaeon]|tara:strand:+ start:664 stop:1401 length:738 start_codon:yes stop_codon:yes gene_type:complete
MNEQERVQGHRTPSLSFLFRNAEGLEKLRDEIVRTARVTGNLASVGCSQGQEAYSIAALLCSQGLDKWKIEGYDINPENIERANEAIYHVRSKPIGSKRHKEAWEYVSRFADEPYGYFELENSAKDEFEEELGAHTAKPSNILRKMCDFACHDIVGGILPIAYDAISCNNVLRYYLEQPEQLSQFMRNLTLSLSPNGLLLIDSPFVLNLVNDEDECTEPIITTCLSENFRTIYESDFNNLYQRNY